MWNSSIEKRGRNWRTSSTAKLIQNFCGLELIDFTYAVSLRITWTSYGRKIMDAKWNECNYLTTIIITKC